MLLCILCKCNCRRRSSQCKSATQFAPQKCVSLITEKFLKKKAANDLLQWPTSLKWHIFAHVLDCSIVPPCAVWGSAAIGLSPRGRDVDQSSPRPDWNQNRQAHPGGRSQKLPPEAEQTELESHTMQCQNQPGLFSRASETYGIARGSSNCMWGFFYFVLFFFLAFSSIAKLIKYILFNISDAKVDLFWYVNFWSCLRVHRVNWCQQFAGPIHLR